MQNSIVNKNSLKQRRWRNSIVAAVVCVIAVGWLTSATGQDVANGTLAGIIRASDHACDRVIEKERVSASVWRVRCNSGQFQVTMNENGNSEVVPLD
jgi:hypothetical protein